MYVDLKHEVSIQNKARKPSKRPQSGEQIILDTRHFGYVLDTVALWIRFGYVLDTLWIRYGYGPSNLDTFWIRTIWIRYGYVLDTEWIRSAADLDTGAKTLLTQYPKFWIRDMPRAMDQSLTDSTFASPVLGWLRAALGWPAPHWDERGTANVESLYGP